MQIDCDDDSYIWDFKLTKYTIIFLLIGYSLFVLEKILLTSTYYD